MEILFSSDSCRLELPFFSVGIALFLIWLLDCFQCIACFLVLLYVLLTFIILLQFFGVVNNFLKFFWKTFFVLSCCCLIDNSKYTTSYYSCQQLFSIFSKNFYPILPNKCSIILCSNSPVFKIQTYVLISVIWEKTDFSSRGW